MQLRAENHDFQYILEYLIVYDAQYQQLNVLMETLEGNLTQLQRDFGPFSQTSDGGNLDFYTIRASDTEKVQVNTYLSVEQSKGDLPLIVEKATRCPRIGAEMSSHFLG